MKSTSILLGSYMLTLKAHRGYPGRIQVLLTNGVDLLNESWIDKDELRQIIDPVILKGL